MNTVFDDVWKKDKECDSWTLEVCRNGIPKVVTVTKDMKALMHFNQRSWWLVIKGHTSYGAFRYLSHAKRYAEKIVSGSGSVE